TLNAHSGPAGTTHINLNGGVVECGAFTYDTPYSMDITEGTLIIRGDVTDFIRDDVEVHHHIKAYGGEGEVVYGYDPKTDRTTVTGLLDPEKAQFPKPSNYAIDACPNVILTWTPGKYAATTQGHDVYFGTNFDDVNDANTTNDPNHVYIDRYDVNSYDHPGLLTYGETYFWRVDEVNDVCQPDNPWKGTVWRFTVETGKARAPSPADNADEVSPNAILIWTGGCLATSYDVYLGTSLSAVDENAKPVKHEHTDSWYNPGGLIDGQTYYWRIDANTPTYIQGEVWTFMTFAVPSVCNWVGGSGGDSWCVKENWDVSYLPGDITRVNINPPPERGPIIDCDVHVFRIRGPRSNSDSDQVMDVKSGNVLIDDYWEWASDGSGTATLNIIGSPDITIGGIWRGTDGGTSILNIEGSPNILCKQRIRFSDVDGTAAFINISGGYINNWGEYKNGDDGDVTTNISGGTFLIGVGDGEGEAWTMDCSRGSNVTANISGTADIFVEGDLLMGNRTRWDTDYGTATINMSGGTLSCRNLRVANNTAKTGILDITCGTITVRNSLVLPGHTDANRAEVNIYGGTVECGTFVPTAAYSMDITEGTLIIDCCAVPEVEAGIAALYITAYGGSGVVQYDFDDRNPGKTTVTAMDSDVDGVSDEAENAAPNGGDGNNDGTADSNQNNVASLPNADDANYVTLVSQADTKLVGVDAISNPSPTDSPPDTEFPIGFFDFTVEGLVSGANTTVTMLLPPGETVETYYKYGPTADDHNDHWYEFLYDQVTDTGAKIFTDRIVLYFVDGQRGDGDLTANGQIVDPGAPGFVPNRPPTANAGDNIQILSAEQAYTVVQGTATDADDDPLQYRWLEGATVLLDWSVVGPTGEAHLDLACLGYLPIGNHTLTLEVADAEFSASDSMILTIQNSPPEAQPAPITQVVELGIDPIVVTAMASDFDGDPVFYEWLKGSEILDSGSTPTSPGGDPCVIPDLYRPAGDPLFPVGTHSIELRVNDGINDDVSTFVEVEVTDTTAPSLSPIPDKSILWPPNHELHAVEIQANAFDNGGGAIDLDVTVQSSEPADADGDGSTIPDYYIDSVDDQTGVIELRLRAERSGKGDGRTYSITITATDASGNQS
ncbi:MAG: choice-of-anchor U domain-containing protein, partial [Planctomycetota bacterium]